MSSLSLRALCCLGLFALAGCKSGAKPESAPAPAQAANAKAPGQVAVPAHGGAGQAGVHGQVAAHGHGGAHGQAGVHGQAAAHAGAHGHGGAYGHAGAQGQAAGDAGTMQFGMLQAAADPSWIREKPANMMRKAQYKVPGSGGPASFVVFQFPGGAGTAKSNLDRWIGQFAPTAAKSAKTKSSKQGSLTVHELDIQGDYQAKPMPGQDPKSIPRGQQRLLAAVIEGQGDPLYFKLLGPVATVSAQADAWKKLLDSLLVRKP